MDCRCALAPAGEISEAPAAIQSPHALSRKGPSEAPPRGCPTQGSRNRNPRGGASTSAVPTRKLVLEPRARKCTRVGDGFRRLALEVVPRQPGMLRPGVAGRRLPKHWQAAEHGQGNDGFGGPLNALPAVKRGRNRARGPSGSRQAGPRLLLLPHRRAAPGADVLVNLLVEQHQKETLSHRHGAFAGRAEKLARFQAFKILLSVRRHHRLRQGLAQLSCLVIFFIASATISHGTSSDASIGGCWRLRRP
jgi:hypothetical protein